MKINYKSSFSLLFIMFLSTMLYTACSKAESRNSFSRQRQNMMDQQIKSRGVKDPQVINAMLKVKRHLFVPEKIEHLAYRDSPLPIGQEQTISQPFIVAFMTEALRLEKDDRVLEIGTGSGYQAAILAEIVNQVYTIEINEQLAKTAAKRLKKLGYANISVKHGDGYKGWPEHASFDAVIVTAAPPTIPEELVKQLKAGGRLVVPVGTSSQELLLITKTETGITKKSLLPVRFVPMIHP